MRLAPIFLIAVVALAGCGSRPEARPQAPAPASADEAPPPETRAAERLYPGQCVPEEGCVRVCVLKDGGLAAVPVVRDPRTGDSTYLDQPFARAFPTDSTYAANAPWYASHERIALPGARYQYVKYGLPRVLPMELLARYGEHHGVPMFIEVGMPAPPEVLYIPVRPGCEFQAYQASGSK